MNLRNLRTLFDSLDAPVRLRILTGIAVLLLVAIAHSAVERRIDTLARKRAAKEKVLAQLVPLRQRYREASQGARALEARLASLSPEDSIGSIVEGTGIRGKNSQIRSLPSSDRGVERGEVKIDSLTANELVNLLHRLEYGPKPVSIGRAAIKVRFDDPSRLDLALTVTLMRPQQGGK